MAFRRRWARPRGGVVELVELDVVARQGARVNNDGSRTVLGELDPEPVDAVAWFVLVELLTRKVTGPGRKSRNNP